MHVLIVDDDFVTRRLLRARLEQHNFIVSEAVHGQAAWELLQEQPISLVITDWLMPIMDGLELIEYIRAHIQNRYVYIILLTSLDNKADVITGLEAGADDYVVKPFNMLELNARLGIGRRVLELEQQLRSLNMQLYQQASYDQLTSLYNRASITKRIEQHLLHARLMEQPISFALCDIDHFKQVNDTYGHHVGDEVLKWVADYLQQSLRANDDTGRWGGEEFLLVLPGASHASATLTLERLRSSLTKTCYSLADGTRLTITISIGAVSTYVDEHTTIESLLSSADQALYAAKRAGRNRLICTEALLQITNTDGVKLPLEP